MERRTGHFEVRYAQREEPDDGQAKDCGCGRHRRHAKQGAAQPAAAISGEVRTKTNRLAIPSTAQTAAAGAMRRSRTSTDRREGEHP
jgi:hypothetical protein